MTAEHVRRLHAPRSDGGRDWCAHCHHQFPCPTFIALVEDEPIQPTPNLEEQHARQLAFLHSHDMHPDYEYKTTRGQRKAWDDANTPPEGDGWERNIDAGRDGWERFDFHEESYWRRRKEAERGQ